MMKENSLRKVLHDRLLTNNIIMLLPSRICLKSKVMFLLKIMLIYDEPLLSGQPPLSSYLLTSILRVAENVAPRFHSEVEAISLTPLPPSPQESALWCIFFALLAKNGPLPAELKFRENTVSIFIIYLEITFAARNIILRCY